MRIAEIYSHLNGQDHVLVHKPELWQEIHTVIETVDAQACKTKVSYEQRMEGRALYDPVELNRAFRAQFIDLSWKESRTYDWVPEDQHLIRHAMQMAPALQKQAIIDTDHTPIFSSNQTDFVKERIAVEVQLGKYASVAYDLFAKHMAYYVGDMIDVAIEILPMKELQTQMSSGIAYYEGELYNVLRHGRSTPAVPLVLVGVVAD